MTTKPETEMPTASEQARRYLSMLNTHARNREGARIIERLMQDLAAAKAKVERYRATVDKYDQAIKEAEVILGGEYGMHYGPFFDLVCAARDALEEK